jgi:hypothetical protein
MATNSTVPQIKIEGRTEKVQAEEKLVQGPFLRACTLGQVREFRDWL